jgi:glycosyltransferase involved in cell wall biosynthesis
VCNADLLPVVRQVRHDAIFSPGPVDTMQFAPDKNKSQRRSDAWTILLFARLDPEKGTETAIQGIIRFADRHPGIHVKLLNYGSLKEQYQRDYGKRFEFIPPLESHEVPHVLQEADVVVGQFLAGALGLSELQAMSCAKPVIASFLYDDAYPTPPPLCNATSPEGVDHHLEMLFQQPEEAITLGNKAREWVIEHHDEKVLVSQLDTLYESMVRCNPDLTHFFRNLDVDSFQPAVHSNRDEEKERR